MDPVSKMVIMASVVTQGKTTQKQGRNFTTKSGGDIWERTGPQLEARRADSGVWFLGQGSERFPHQLGAWSKSMFMFGLEMVTGGNSSH